MAPVPDAIKTAFLAAKGRKAFVMMNEPLTLIYYAVLLVLLNMIIS